MLTILYSPHATSTDNQAGRASGHADVPLSPLGEQQAQQRAQDFTREKVDAVFASDLQRAAVTARVAFAARSIPITLDARLRECDYGDWTQFPKEKIDEESPQRITEPFPNGESVWNVVERVGAFLRDAFQSYDGQTIVVIGHRATRYALDYWCGSQTLAEIVSTPWEWKAVPIWRYTLDADQLERRSVPSS
jgi:broad specificity phosphatase PhoE